VRYYRWKLMLHWCCLYMYLLFFSRTIFSFFFVAGKSFTVVTGLHFLFDFIGDWNVLEWLIRTSSLQYIMCISWCVYIPAWVMYLLLLQGLGISICTFENCSSSNVVPTSKILQHSVHCFCFPLLDSLCMLMLLHCACVCFFSSLCVYKQHDVCHYSQYGLQVFARCVYMKFSQLFHSLNFIAS